MTGTLSGSRSVLGALQPQGHTCPAGVTHPRACSDAGRPADLKTSKTKARQTFCHRDNIRSF